MGEVKQIKVKSAETSTLLVKIINSLGIKKEDIVTIVTNDKGFYVYYY